MTRTVTRVRLEVWTACWLAWHVGGVGLGLGRGRWWAAGLHALCVVAVWSLARTRAVAAETRAALRVARAEAAEANDLWEAARRRRMREGARTHRAVTPPGAHGAQTGTQTGAHRCPRAD